MVYGAKEKGQLPPPPVPLLATCLDSSYSLNFSVASLQISARLIVLHIRKESTKTQATRSLRCSRSKPRIGLERLFATVAVVIEQFLVDFDATSCDKDQSRFIVYIDDLRGAVELVTTVVHQTTKQTRLFRSIHAKHTYTPMDIHNANGQRL